MTQLDLFPPRRGNGKAPIVTAYQVTALTEYLLLYPGRHFSRRELAALPAFDGASAGKPRSTDSRIRLVRDAAEVAGADIVRGQNGYIHRRWATAEEIQAAAAQAISQSDRMRAYGVALLAAAHRDLKSQPEK